LTQRLIVADYVSVPLQERQETVSLLSGPLPLGRPQCNQPACLIHGSVPQTLVHRSRRLQGLLSVPDHLPSPLLDLPLWPSSPPPTKVACFGQDPTAGEANEPSPCQSTLNSLRCWRAPPAAPTSS